MYLFISLFICMYVLYIRTYIHVHAQVDLEQLFDMIDSDGSGTVEASAGQPTQTHVQGLAGVSIPDVGYVCKNKYLSMTLCKYVDQLGRIPETAA